MVLGFLFLESPLLDMLSWFNQNLRAVPFAQAVIVLLLIALLAFDIVLPVPSSVVALTAVIWLGTFVGAGVIFLGLCLGCILGYALGAGWCRIIFTLPTSQDYKRAKKITSLPVALALLGFRPVPILAEISVLAAGLAGYSLKAFLLLTSAANVVLTLGYVFLGSAMASSL